MHVGEYHLLGCTDWQSPHSQLWHPYSVAMVQLQSVQARSAGKYVPFGHWEMADTSVTATATNMVKRVVSMFAWSCVVLAVLGAVCRVGFLDWFNGRY